MKTVLLSLEAHDTPVSIRDRMVWAKNSRILLLWPSRGKPQIRPFDLTLLWRQACAQGAALALVTRDSSIQQAARRLGLSTFSRPQAAQTHPWKSPLPTRLPAPRRLPLRQMRQELPSLPHLQNLSARLLAFSLGVGALLAVAWALASLFSPSFFS